MNLRSVILADDSQSCDISDLFVQLKNSTTLLLEQYNMSHNDIDVETKIYLSDSISKQGISEKMALINIDSFMCFWYGHGKNGSFCIGNEEVVTTTENYYVFSNALIYTFSCHNGNELADALVANNTKAFIGYTDYANCPYGIDDVTTEIVMSFITSFLEGKTVNEAKTVLEEAYTQAIYDESIDPLLRPLFQTNRDNLIVKGDGNICINDLFIYNIVSGQF